MAIEHMVWIKFHDDVPQTRRDSHIANLKSMPGRIPGIVSLRIGENFTDRANGYTHGLVITFDNRADLEAYLPHPIHIEIITAMKPDIDAMAMDIEY